MSNSTWWNTQNEYNNKKAFVYQLCTHKFPYEIGYSIFNKPTSKRLYCSMVSCSIF